MLRNQALLDSTEKTLTTSLHKLLLKKRTSIIAQVTKAYNKITKSDDGDDILGSIDLEGWDDFTSVLDKSLKKVAVDSGQTATLHFGFEDAVPDITSLVNEDAVEFAKQRSAEIVGKKWVDGELVDNPDAKWVISDSTREMLRADVETALTEGWSSQDLADSLEDSLAFSEERAIMIARTELARAHVEGQMFVYNNAGVTKKQWILGSESCDDCQENANAGVIDFDEAFPSGDDAPPAHPNCTCDVVPIIDPVDSTDNEDNEE